MSMNSISIGSDGNKVILTVNGKSIVIPWAHADEIAKGLTAKARQAEEDEKALGIIKDNALLLRLGVPIGLSNRKDIIQETIKEAKYDSDLRRYIPSIKSKEVFGVPRVRQHG